MLFPLHLGRARFTATAATAAVISMTAALTGCSDSNGGGSPASSSGAPPASPSPSGGGKAEITIQNFAFRPAALTVAPGTKVTVVNKDSTTHTVTAGSTFNTGDVAAGKTVTFTAPSKTGAYGYDCTIHPFMKGSLTVR